MAENFEHNDFIEEPKPKKNDYLKGTFRELLDGSILTKASFTKQLPFIFFLAVLGVLYIGNRFKAEKIIQQNMHLQKEIKELRAQSITTAAELMYMRKQSEVIKLLRNRGLELEESTEPPIKIELED